jgi:multiple sugar transport system substrate-binding protein
MRAWVVAVLGLAVACGAVAAWGHRWRSPWSGGAADRRVTIELSVFGMPWENRLYTEEYIPAFERENPGIRVKFLHLEDYLNRLLLCHAGGIAPDVMRQNTSWGGLNLILRGMNLPLDRFIDGPDGIDRSDFIPVIWQSVRHRGRTYGLPQDINMLGLFYNKAIFDAHGMKYPDPSWTWADLKAAADRLTIDADHDGHPEVLGLNAGWSGYTLMPFYFQLGGKVWDAAREEPQLDNPTTVEALTFFKSLKRSYSLTQSNSERGGIGPSTFFQQGRVAMFIDGTWRTPQLKTSAPNLEFGVTSLPRGKRHATIASSCFWGVSSQTKHPELAWKLVKFLSGKEQLVRYWQVLWVAPPARWSALRSAGFRRVTGMGDKILGIDTPREFEEKCGWIPRSLEAGWASTEQISPFTNQMFDQLNRAVDRVMLEGADPAAALRVAMKETRDEIAEARRGFVMPVN